MIVVRCTELDRIELARINVDPELLKDNGNNYLGKKVQKPWGHEIERYKDENLSVWWLYLDSGQATSMHCHPGKTTMLIVVAGVAVISTLSGSHGMSEGEIAIIEAGAFHRTASTRGPLVLYEIETPPNKRNLVRLLDDYGRGQGYEGI